MNHRHRVLLTLEGQMLQLAAANGNEAAADHIRGVVDGCFNALMRVDSPDGAAKYALALADRIVGRVELPTAWPLPKLPEAVVVAVPPEAPVLLPAPAETPRPQRMSFWTIFAIGFCLGAIVTCGIAFAVPITRWLIGVGL